MINDLITPKQGAPASSDQDEWEGGDFIQTASARRKASAFAGSIRSADALRADPNLVFQNLMHIRSQQHAKKIQAMLSGLLATMQTVKDKVDDLCKAN